MLRPDALPRLAVERDQHHRAAAALDQARGDDPGDPRVPAVGGEHVGRPARRAPPSALRPRSGCGARRRGARCWPSRARARPRSARARVLGEQQLERGVGAVEASGRVQPRREREGDGALVDARRVPPARPPSARAARASSVAPRRRSPRAAERAVLAAAAARRRRSSRAPRGRGRPRARAPAGRRSRTAPARACRRRPSRTARGRGSRTAPGARSARRGSLPSARGAWWSVTTTSRPSARAAATSSTAADGAVGGDQQPGAARGQPLDGGQAEPVAVARAVGQVPVDVGAERAQRAHQHRRRADAVDVVVAVHGDPRRAREVRTDQRDAPAPMPAEGARRDGAPRAPGTRGARGIAQAAAHEHLRERVAHAAARPRRRATPPAGSAGISRRQRCTGARAYGPRGTEPPRAAPRPTGRAARPSARSRRMPSRYTSAMPISAPGTAYSTTRDVGRLFAGDLQRRDFHAVDDQPDDDRADRASRGRRRRCRPRSGRAARS